MILKTISFKNIGSFEGEHKVVFEKNTINYIQGIHENNENKSNASGKTTFINIILYGLFDKCIYGDSFIYLVNKNYNDFYIKVNVIFNGVEFHIIKNFSIKKDKIIKEYTCYYGKNNEEIIGVQNVKLLIEQHLKNIDNMFFYCFTDTNSINQFINSSNIEKYKNLCNLMNLQKFNLAEKTFIKQKKSVDENYIKQQTLIQEYESTLKNINEQHKNYNIDDINNNLNKINIELNQIENNKENCIKEISNIENNKNNLLIKQKNIVDNKNLFTKLNNNIENLNNIINKIKKDKQNLTEKWITQNEFYKRLIVIIKRFLNQNNYTIKDNIDESLINVVDVLKTDSNTIKQKIEFNIKHINLLKKEICYVCNRKFDDPEKDINKLNHENKNFESEYQKINNNLDQCNSMLNEYKISFDKLQTIKLNGNELNTQLKSNELELKNLIQQKENISIEDDKDLQNKINEYDKILNQHNIKLNDFKNDLNIKNELKENLLKDKNNYDNISNSIIEYTNNLNKTNKIFNTIKNEMKILNECIYLCKLNGGFIPRFIDYYSKLIEQKFNYYNTKFFSLDYDLNVKINVKTKLNSSIEFIFEDKNENKSVPFIQLSGAERFIAYILIKISIKNIFYDKNILDLIIFDEPFGILDTQNKYNLTEFFKELNNSFFSQLVYTSHTSLPIANDKIIKIIKNKNISKIKND